MNKIIASFCLALFPALAGAANDNPVSPESSEQVIQPQVDRRSIDVPKIRARDYEFGGFVGLYNLESFGVSPVYGLRLGYQITEDYFTELTVAASPVTDANFRNVGIPVFEDENTLLVYYNLSAGINLFPGEIFLGQGRAWGTSIYVIGGIGNTSFDILDNITFNVGVGMRVLPSRRWSVRFEYRDHMFQSDLLGPNKLTHNLEFTAGLALHF